MTVVCYFADDTTFHACLITKLELDAALAIEWFE